MPLGRAAAWGSGGFDEQDTRNEERVRRDFWRKAARVAARLPFAEDLLAAYYCAFDQATPFQVRAALVGALAYFVLPFDFLPTCCRSSALPTMPPYYSPRYVWWPATCVRSIAMRPAARSNGSRPARGRAGEAAERRGPIPREAGRATRIGAGAVAHTRTTSLPITLRSASALSAVGVSASGYTS